MPPNWAGALLYRVMTYSSARLLRAATGRFGVLTPHLLKVSRLVRGSTTSWVYTSTPANWLSLSVKLTLPVGCLSGYRLVDHPTRCNPKWRPFRAGIGQRRRPTPTHQTPRRLFYRSMSAPSSEQRTDANDL